MRFSKNARFINAPLKIVEPFDVIRLQTIAVRRFKEIPSGDFEARIDVISEPGIVALTAAKEVVFTSVPIVPSPFC